MAVIHVSLRTFNKIRSQSIGKKCLPCAKYINKKKQTNESERNWFPISVLFQLESEMYANSALVQSIIQGRH